MEWDISGNILVIRYSCIHHLTSANPLSITTLEPKKQGKENCCALLLDETKGDVSTLCLANMLKVVESLNMKNMFRLGLLAYVSSN